MICEPYNDRKHRCVRVTVGEPKWANPIKEFFRSMKWVRSSNRGKIVYWNDKVITFDTETTAGTKTEVINGVPVERHYSYTYIATAALGDPYYEDAVKVIMRTQEHMAMFMNVLFAEMRKAAPSIQSRRDYGWNKHGKPAAIRRLENRIARLEAKGGTETVFGKTYTAEEVRAELDYVKTLEQNPRSFVIRLKVFVHNLQYDFHSYLRNFIHTDYDDDAVEAMKDSDPMQIGIDPFPLPSVTEEIKRYVTDKLSLISDLRSDDEPGATKRFYIIDQLFMDSTTVQHATFGDERSYLRKAAYNAIYQGGEDLTQLPEGLLSTDGKNYVTARIQEFLESITGIQASFDDVGIEFTDSYVLVGTTLAEACKDFPEYLQKRVVRDSNGNVIEADLDYSKIRHSSTVLTEKELNYALDDCIALAHVINRERCQDLQGSEIKWKHRMSMGSLPMTKTQKVRRYARDKTVHKSRNYKKWIKSTEIRSIEERDFIMQGFHGGFTHANKDCVEHIELDVAHVDFTSSYPFVLLTEKFPYGQPEIKESMTLEEINELSQRGNVWWMAYVELKNARIKPGVAETPMTSSIYSDSNRGGAYIYNVDGSRGTKDCILNNGRLLYAPVYGKVMACSDWHAMDMTVDYDEVTFASVHIWKAGYLPTELAASIGELYKMKTVLKGVEGSEVQYQGSKSMLNSTYGMCVTDEFRNSYNYDHGKVVCRKMTFEDMLNKLAQINSSRETFLNPLWGIACTAYALYNLFIGIVQAGIDDLYQDTDAIFYKASSKRMASFVKWYNEVRVPEKVAAVLKARPKLSPDYFTPTNQFGETKPLGAWTVEPHCLAFKSLGAKRYLEFRWSKEKDSEGHEIKVKKFFMTVAGANKNHGSQFFNDRYSENIARGMSEDEAMTDCFNVFTAIGKETGCGYDPLVLLNDKLVPHYLGNRPDELSCNMTLTDESGASEICVQKYGVALLSTDFKMSNDGTLIPFVIKNLNEPRKRHR